MVHKPIYNWETIQIRGYCHANKTKMGAGHHFAQNPAQKKGRWNPSFSRSNLDTTLQKKNKNTCIADILAYVPSKSPPRFGFNYPSWPRFLACLYPPPVTVSARSPGLVQLLLKGSRPSPENQVMDMSLTRPGKLTVCELVNGHRNSEFSQL